MIRPSSCHPRHVAFGSRILNWTAPARLALVVGLCAAPALGQASRPTMTCELSSDSAHAGTSVTLDLFLEDAVDVRGYQATIAIVRTSGSGEVTVPCPGGVEVDEDDPDFIFPGLDTPGLVPECPNCGVIVPDCEGQRVAVARVNGGVDVLEGPAYLATYTLHVSESATPGSEFRISIVPYPESILATSDKAPIPFDTGPGCTIKIPTICGNNIREGIEECDGKDDQACLGRRCQRDCTCPVPTLTGWGLIALTLLLLSAITIKFGRRGFKLTGNGGYPFAALALFLALPAASASGQFCESDAECNDGNVCTFDECFDSVCWSAPTVYGDIAGIDGCGPDDAVDEFDVYAVEDAFRDVAEGCSPENADIRSAIGCEPDGKVDLFDFLAILSAFGGAPNCPCCFLEFIDDANNIIPRAGQDAHLDVSNMKTDVSLPDTATFDGPPTTDPDNFRVQAMGIDIGLSPKVKLTVTSAGIGTYTHTFEMIEGPSPRYRINEHVRLVSNDTDDAHLAHQTPKARIGDGVKAELILDGRTRCASNLPVCRPFAEDHNHAIRTVRNYFVEVDIPGTVVAANSDVPTTDRRMDEAWAQCCVRFDSTTRERAPVSNVLRITGISTPPGGNVNVTVDGVAVGPIAIANNRSAFQVAQDIATGINAAIPAAGAGGFNTFPPNNIAHMVAKKGNNVAYAGLAETVPGIAISVPALNFGNGIEFNNEEAALAANFGDEDANTIDLFIVDTLTTGNRGDAWPRCHASIGNNSDLRHTSFIVLSAADAAVDNPHTAAHEAGRMILDFCGLHAGNFNLMNGTRANDSIAARKRLEDAQCTTARTTSNGTLLRQE